jgi:hypothetical protein
MPLGHEDKEDPISQSQQPAHDSNSRQQAPPPGQKRPVAAVAAATARSSPQQGSKRQRLDTASHGATGDSSDIVAIKTASQPFGWPSVQAAHVRDGPLKTLAAHIAQLQQQQQLLLPSGGQQRGGAATAATTPGKVGPCTVLALVVNVVPVSTLTCRNLEECEVVSEWSPRPTDKKSPAQLTKTPPCARFSQAKLYLLDGSMMSRTSHQRQGISPGADRSVPVALWRLKARAVEALRDSNGNHGAVRIGDVVQISQVFFSVYCGQVSGSAGKSCRLLLASRDGLLPKAAPAGARCDTSIELMRAALDHCAAAATLG